MLLEHLAGLTYSEALVFCFVFLTVIPSLFQSFFFSFFFFLLLSPFNTVEGFVLHLVVDLKHLDAAHVNYSCAGWSCWLGNFVV